MQSPNTEPIRLFFRLFCAFASELWKKFFTYHDNSSFFFDSLEQRRAVKSRNTLHSSFIIVLWLTSKILSLGNKNKILHSSLFILHFFVSLWQVSLFSSQKTHAFSMKSSPWAQGGGMILSVNNSISYLFRVSWNLGNFIDVSLWVSQPVPVR